MHNEFSQAVGILIEKNTIASIVSGIATNVREESFDLIREGQADIFDVRLKSVLKGVQSLFKVTPKENSIVLAGLIDNDAANAVLIACSDIEAVEIKIDGAQLLIKNGKFTIKNTTANLKDIINDSLSNLQQAVITTPAGPGALSPADVAKIEAQKQKNNQLWH